MTEPIKPAIGPTPPPAAVQPQATTGVSNKTPEAKPEAKAITNETVRKIEESRHPQPNPRDPWEGVVAAPMSAPAIDQIKKLNPNIELRWVNRSVITSGTPTRRFEECLSMGWVPATSADCVPPPGTLKDGVITAYDVILMKIDRMAYLGHMKWNNDRVNQAVRQSGEGTAKQELRDSFAKEGVLSKARGKVDVFIPGTKDLQGLK